MEHNIVQILSSDLVPSKEQEEVNTLFIIMHAIGKTFEVQND